MTTATARTADAIRRLAAEHLRAAGHERAERKARLGRFHSGAVARAVEAFGFDVDDDLAGLAREVVDEIDSWSSADIVERALLALDDVDRAIADEAVRRMDAATIRCLPTHHVAVDEVHGDGKGWWWCNGRDTATFAGRDVEAQDHRTADDVVIDVDLLVDLDLAAVVRREEDLVDGCPLHRGAVDCGCHVYAHGRGYVVVNVRVVDRHGRCPATGDAIGDPIADVVARLRDGEEADAAE
jgi:hypothetical protein